MPIQQQFTPPELLFSAFAGLVDCDLSSSFRQVYLQHIKEQKLGPQRKLHLTARGKEPFIFTRCFHGWSDWPAAK